MSAPGVPMNIVFICRTPSRRPFFPAGGRPVITSPARPDRYLKHEEHCPFPTDSSADTILRRYLSWDKSAARVEALYQRVLGDEEARG